MNTRSQPVRNKNSEGKLDNRYSSTRKRVRNPEFDLNQSTIPTEAKQRRVIASGSKMANTNIGQIEPMITDLSNTIHTGSQGEVVVPNTRVATDEAVNTNIGSGIMDDAPGGQNLLDDKVRRMVQEEMKEVKKTIRDLAKTIENLSRIAINSQRGISAGDNHVQARDHNGDRSSHEGININNAYLSRPNSYRFGSDTENISRGLQLEGNPAQCPSRDDNNARSMNNGNFDFRQIRLDKLGIIFDNKSISIDDFIFRLEHLRAHYNIPEREVVRDFHLLVSDSVKDWYWSFIESHGVTEWPVLRLALLSQYKSPQSNFEIMRDLVERKQGSNETIDAYFYIMNKLRSKLTQPIPEYDMIKIMKRNINMNVARIVYPIAVSSVEQLRIECNEAEKNFPRRELRNSIPLSRGIRQINEVYVDTEETENNNTSVAEIIDLEALQTNQQQKAVVTCWNCRVMGHVFMECPIEQRTLFCYKCGKPDVTTPKCPNCNQKNSKSGVVMTGESRPRENPAVKRS